LHRENFPVWSSLMVLLSGAYLFAPATIWRPSLTLLLFLWSLFTAIGFARGREPETVVDPLFPARLPLRRPKRIYGIREVAFAAVAGALALIFGVHLFTPAPPPVETQPAQEETAAPEGVEAAAESAEPKESPVAEQPAAEPTTYTTRAGDTFKTIAKRVYGDASKAPDIARANPDVKPKAKLRAGRKIKLPAPAKPPGD
jgi:LysM repeat protein